MMSLLQVNGRNLRVLRQLRGFSLKQLSAASGVSVSHISRAERGERNMSPDMVAKVAEAMCIPIGAILTVPAGVQLGSRREEVVA